MTVAFWRSVGRAFCRKFLSWDLSDGSLVIGLGLRICRQNPTEAVSLLITFYQDVRDDPHVASAVTLHQPPPAEAADCLLPRSILWKLVTKSAHAGSSPPHRGPVVLLILVLCSSGMHQGVSALKCHLLSMSCPQGGTSLSLCLSPSACLLLPQPQVGLHVGFLHCAVRFTWADAQLFSHSGIDCSSSTLEFVVWH